MTLYLVILTNNTIYTPYIYGFGQPLAYCRRPVYTQICLHTDLPTHRSAYTQTVLLYILPHRPDYTQICPTLLPTLTSRYPHLKATCFNGAVLGNVYAWTLSAVVQAFLDINIVSHYRVASVCYEWGGPGNMYVCMHARTHTHTQYRCTKTWPDLIDWSLVCYILMGSPWISMFSLV